MKSEAMKLSQQQEKRIAKRIGGTRNKGSGSQWTRKGDVRDKEKLFEMKRTNTKGIRITEVDLEKVRKEAALTGRESVLHFELGKRRYVIIEEDDYFEGG